MSKQLFLIFLFFIPSLAFSQSCLPNGITLSNQNEVDLFTSFYPDCTEIIGTLNIDGADIINLDSLENIEMVGGALNVHSTSLVNLSGLDKITFIGDYLSIENNDLLTSLSGINQLFNFGSSIYIQNNNVLMNIHALNNITTLEDLYITSNNMLQDLTGLDGLSFVEIISVRNNDQLNSLNGLGSITTITNEIDIYENLILSDISAIGGIDLSAMNNLFINENPQLALCSYPSICSFLSAGGTANITNNAPGCQSALSIIGDCCSMDSSYCPALSSTCFQGGINLSTQADIDLIEAMYPDCIEIIGTLNIYGTDITNLDGLENIEIVGGALNVHSTSLVNLSGLDKITSIGDYLSIENNDLLTSLSGLNQLSNLGSSIYIQNNNVLMNIHALNNITTLEDLYITSNNMLQDLTGLDGLSSAEIISVRNNDQLNSLNGLGSITTITNEIDIYENLILSDISAIQESELSSINILSINNNPQLSMCSHPSICTYIISGGVANINNNAIGCQGVLEVESNCFSEFYYFTASSGSWDNPSNWSGNMVPDAGSYVIILAGNSCTIPSNYDAECNQITVEDGAIFCCPVSSILHVFGL